MGQPVTVIEKPSATPGVIRFEINRTLSGMGHETFRSLDDAAADTPSADLARRLFENGGVASVHVYANVITVQLEDGATSAGLRDAIENMYIFYGPGVEPVVPT